MPKEKNELKEIVYSAIGKEEAINIQKIVEFSYYLDKFGSPSQINNFTITCR